MSCALENMQLSARVKTLRKSIVDAVPGQGRTLREPDEERALAESIYQMTIIDPAAPPMLRRARVLEHFAAHAPVKIQPQELIVGSQRFGIYCNLSKYYTPEQLTDFPRYHNHGHITVDYSLLLQHGINGMLERIEGMKSGVNRDSMTLALVSFKKFILRHAEVYETAGRHDVAIICRTIADAPPKVFREAIQLVWFTQIFLHVEGNAAAVSFGRFDQYLGPFLEADIERGVITMEQAFELLCCFCLKTCEGDESQNLLLGGEAASGGRSGENLLSLMFLRVMTLLQVWQPSISVRIGPYTSEEFWKESLNLCATGIGMPSFFNEPVVTESIRVLGVPPERASDWGIVGCYEAATQGDSYPLTVGAQWALPSLFLRFLDTREAVSTDDFNVFFGVFKDFFRMVYQQENLPVYQQRWNELQQQAASPFESVCVRGCIESGLATEEGGAPYNWFGINILGIGTLIDSLLAVKQLVFTEHLITMSEFVGQLKGNFSDEHLLARCRHLLGKFGSDLPDSNTFARDVAALAVDTVLASSLENGVRPYPGLFWFAGDILIKIPATPDGRREGDYLSYGCGPGAFLSSGSPTSILNAVAKLPHDRCGCGNPLTISLDRSELADAQGKQLLRQLIDGYFRQGGFHLHINLASPDELRKAQENPDGFRNLVVRISGFSTVFVTLDRRWQDAIIERKTKGM